MNNQHNSQNDQSNSDNQTPARHNNHRSNGYHSPSRSLSNTNNNILHTQVFLPPTLQQLDLSGLQMNSTNERLIMTLFQIVQQQTYALQNLMVKVEQMKKKTNSLTDKLKVIINKSNQNQQVCKIQEKTNKKQKLSEHIDSQSLIHILFGKQEYQYKLQLAEIIELPLYRERNFSISIQLKNYKGEKICNENRIPLSLAIYSCENPPKFLQANTAGQKMVKGYTEQNLQNGICYFQKIQIREVTSHFRNGWVFIVVIPSMTPLGDNSNGITIDYRQIEPLVLQKIVVKAKKIKQHNKNSKNEQSGQEAQNNDHQSKNKQSSSILNSKCYQDNSS